MSDTWYPGAIRRNGPAAKIQSRSNPARGIVLHSAVGYRGGLYSVLDNVVGSRATVAWHFSVYQNGTVEQHYPIEAVLHHAGNGWANANLIGVEHEGGFDPIDEPLTPAQRTASVNLVRWIAAQRGWVPSRTTNKTLFEHNEISDTVTQCPSGRIPWSHYTIAPVEEAYMDRDYTVIRPGEWLSRDVAPRTGLTVARIVELNNIADASKVEAFQILRLNDRVPLPPPAYTGPSPARINTGVNLLKESRSRIDSTISLLEGK